MSVGSGLGGSFGLGVESTYGTIVAPTRWHEVESAPFKYEPTRVQGGGLSGGNLFDRGARYADVLKSASGSVLMEVTNKTMGLLLAQCFGIAPSAVAAGSGWSYTFPLSDNVGKFFTGQVGVPDLTGTVVPYTASGCKVTKFSFTLAQGGLLMLSAEINARNLVDTTTITTPTYVTGLNPFHFAQFTAKLDTVAVQGVKGFTVDVERPQHVDRQYANNAGLKAEPIVNGKTRVTGSVDVDLVAKANFVDRYNANTAANMELAFVGAAMGGSNEGLSLTCAQTFFTGTTPGLDGEDVVSFPVPFEAKFDGTNNPLIAVYKTLDAAL